MKWTLYWFFIELVATGQQEIVRQITNYDHKHLFPVRRLAQEEDYLGRCMLANKWSLCY